MKVWVLCSAARTKWLSRSPRTNTRVYKSPCDCCLWVFTTHALMSVTIVDSSTSADAGANNQYKRYSTPASTTQPALSGAGQKRRVGSRNGQELYYFARSFKDPNSMQVQRLHRDSHPDPLFNVTARTVNKKTSRVKQGLSLNGDLSIATSTDPCPSTVLYDGSCAPLSSGDHFTQVYTAQPYDSATSGPGAVHRGFAQFSRYGVFFNPRSTPLVLPDSTVRSRANSSACSSDGDETTNGTRNSISTIGRSSIDVATLDPFFYQPIAWLIVPDGTSAFRLVDQSTNTAIGRWSRRRNSHNSEYAWVFTCKGEILAAFDNGRLKVSPHPSTATYVDQEIKKLRLKTYAKRTNQSPTDINMPKTSIRNSISSIARSHSTNAIINSNFIASEYRPRFVDGILFSYLALQLNLESTALDDGTKLHLPESTDGNYYSHSKKRLSSFVSTIKSVFKPPSPP